MSDYRVTKVNDPNGKGNYAYYVQVGGKPYQITTKEVNAANKQNGLPAFSLDELMLIGNRDVREAAIRESKKAH